MTGGDGDGTLLAGRYRLQHVLGEGGMARVHAAHDQLLERQVAVKTLLGRFREDEDFVGRFRREAQNAASLNHPNIVAVYDTGQHDGLPFIVMQLVRGRSLQEAIAGGGLTEERALEVCGDVCSALAYAHQRGLVHRDIKPGNVLLGDDGTVKVTDFGIARAAAAQTVTRTAAVLGTAAYLSPEQARGQAVDARSDLYSLGVVLYETLTGRKPFEGDSAVTVAYQHVQETPLPPRDWDQDISPAAEAITVRALAKDPDHRYPDALTMRRDLMAARVGDQISAPAVVREDQTALLDGARQDQPVPTEQRQRRSRTIGYVLLGLLTAAAAVAGVLFTGSLLAGDEAGSVSVPDVTRQTVPEARDNLEAQGLVAEVQDTVFSTDVPRGQVVRQDPSGGTLVARGETVDLFVSSGPQPVTVPEVVGRPEEEATAALRNAGLVPGNRTTEFSNEYDQGVVIAADPSPGETVDEGTAVELVVSAGQERVRVPPVENQTEADARFELEEGGFEVLVLREFHPTVPEGVVIRQDPEAGTETERGAQVTITVSRGPQAEPSPERTAPPDTEPPQDPEDTEPPITPTAPTS